MFNNVYNDFNNVYNMFNNLYNDFNNVYNDSIFKPYYLIIIINILNGYYIN